MRLATFNILHGRSTVDDRVDVDRFADAVRSLDADVLALQEVDRDQPRSHRADLTAVAAEAAGAADHRFVATLVGEPGVWSAPTGEHQPGQAAYGIAIVSRYPVLGWRTVIMPPPRTRIPVRFPGSRLPTLVRDEPRAALVATVQAPAGRATVVCAHLTFVPGRNLTQLVRLTRSLAADTPHGEPVMLLGDLNVDAPQAARASGWHPLATAHTFPVESPARQLDHVLAHGPVRATGPAHAVDTGLSDHRALVVQVALGGEHHASPTRSHAADEDRAPAAPSRDAE
ncbi:endonuclease/exonuclease/phosphatase family protein [Cellulosimicrobium sp. NPDC057127]|uniref:endonuclease/exonuclease/phosphatase family protein n=1 Tax=Cellulosimicrobium sp. NPDC057127 TaxID=3346026 RepID=UPI003637C3E6